MADLTPQDRDMMIRTIIGEAGDQPDDGQAAVASVILNRSNSDQWRGSPTDVVLQPGQFEPWQTRARELLSIDPNSEAYQRAGAIVDGVASGKVKDITNGATYFLQPDIVRSRYGRLPAWAQGPGQRIGAHVFYGGNPKVAQNQPAQSPDDPGTVSDADVADTARMLGLKVGPKAAVPATGVSPAASPPAAATATAVTPDDVAETAKELGITITPKKAQTTQPPQAVQTPQGTTRVYIGKRAPIETYGPTKQRPGDFTSEMVQGMPLIGPLFNKGVAAAQAGLDPLINYIKGEPNTTDFSSRYAANLRDIQGAAKAYQDEHPVASTVADLIGGGMALGPMARAANAAGSVVGASNLGGRLLGTAGETIPIRMLTGGAGGAGVGAGDAYLRGDNPVGGAILGGGAGAAGPLIGEAVRGGTGWLVNNVLPRSGPLAKYMGSTVSRLINATEGETPESMAAARDRMGPHGFIGDLNTGLTDLTGAAADIAGPQKQVVRSAYGARNAGQRGRISSELDNAFGTPATDVNAFTNYLTETRAKAADPLYKQFRDMQVHPTDKLKELIPRLEAAGAMDMGEELSNISGKPLNRKFFTTGEQKEYPTTEAWDYIKRGLDRGIDKAYRSGDKTLARELVNLKREMINEIGKTKAGKVWAQARSEFADRSAIIDQLAAGKDDFLGGRAGITADELREELSTLKGPELAARKIGARTAVDEAMGATLHGDGTMRAKLLAPNNQKKLRLLLGDAKAEKLIQSLEQEHYLSGQSSNVIGNIQTGASAPMRSQRRDALLPNPMQPWGLDLTKPTTWLPPSVREGFAPHGIVNAVKGARAQKSLNELAPLLVTPQKSVQFNELIDAIHAEQARRANSPLANLGRAANNRLSGLVAVPAVEQRTHYAK